MLKEKSIFVKSSGAHFTSENSNNQDLEPMLNVLEELVLSIDLSAVG